RRHRQECRLNRQGGTSCGSSRRCGSCRCSCRCPCGCCCSGCCPRYQRHAVEDWAEFGPDRCHREMQGWDVLAFEAARRGLLKPRRSRRLAGQAVVGVSSPLPPGPSEFHNTPAPGKGGLGADQGEPVLLPAVVPKGEEALRGACASNARPVE